MTVRYLRLADVCEINPRLPRTHGLVDDDEVSFVPMAAVDEVSGAIKSAEVRRYAEVKKGYTFFADGDVLFAKITPCMENGKAALAGDLVGGRGFGSTEFHVLRAGDQVMPEWLRYFVRRESFRYEAKRNFTGTAGQQRVPASFLQNAVIPVPSRGEQQRIVDLLSRAEGIVRLRRQAQQKAAELIPAIFADMFGDPVTNPKGWPETRLEAFVEEFRYGTSQKSGEQGYPTLRIPNVIGNALDPGDMKLVAVLQAEADRLRLVEGDLLFVRTNGNPDNVGRSAVYAPSVLDRAGFDGSNCLYASYLIRARLDLRKVVPQFLQAFLSSAEGRKRIRSEARTSAGQYNINTQGLGSVLVPLPPLELQLEFVRRCQPVAGLVELQATASQKVEAVFESLLSRAFSTEAVAGPLHEVGEATT
jgi:type I restriction enzyme S subunit